MEVMLPALGHLSPDLSFQQKNGILARPGEPALQLLHGLTKDREMFKALIYF